MSAHAYFLLRVRLERVCAPCLIFLPSCVVRLHIPACYALSNVFIYVLCTYINIMSHSQGTVSLPAPDRALGKGPVSWQALVSY